MSRHPLLARQIRKATGPDGALDVDRLLTLVETAYQEHEDDRRRAERTSRVVAAELEAVLARLQEQNVGLEAARKAAEAANESKSRFLANMSHEIRTPLNGILGVAQVLAAADIDAENRQHVASILESGRTLTAILNDVLDLSKIEAGKFDIVRSDVDVACMLGQLVTLWKPRADEKQLELVLDIDDGFPVMQKVDPVRIQQCVSNLLSNAIKFTATGRVRLAARARPLEGGGHTVEIEVADTGAGMDSATLARLFMPFEQANDTIARTYGGTGLGLSITRRLAELMGGAAWARSQPGAGSVFTVSYHAEPSEARPGEAGAPACRQADTSDRRALLSGKRILVVDDNAINRKVVSLFLKPLGVTVAEAENGQLALDRLEREPFDLVLLDMHMPVMDGPTTIRRLRAALRPHAGLPVIALTAEAMSGDRERFLAMGMDGYLSKPISQPDLAAELVRLLAGGASASVPAPLARIA